jgi:hypothetical protein
MNLTALDLFHHIGGEYSVELWQDERLLLTRKIGVLAIPRDREGR